MVTRPHPLGALESWGAGAEAWLPSLKATCPRGSRTLPVPSPVPACSQGPLPPCLGSPLVLHRAGSQLGCSLGEVPGTRGPEALPVGRRLGCRGGHHCLCSAKCASRRPAKRGLSTARLLADARPLRPSCRPCPPLHACKQPGTPPGGAGTWGPRRVSGQGPGPGHTPKACTIDANKEGGVFECRGRGGSASSGQLGPPAGWQAASPLPCVRACLCACACLWACM